MKMLLPIICLLLTGVMSCPDLSAGETGTRQVQDQVGRVVQIPVRPQRIVSLIPSLTEIVFALDRGSLLVGATQFAREPAAAAELPRVGSYLHLDIERIVALEPDLCLASRDGNPAHLVRRIEQLGIPVVAFDPKSLPEIIDSVRILGEMLQAEEKAAEIASSMEKKIAAVDRKVKRAGARPGVFFQIDASPIISAGSDTFIHRLITGAGGRNLAAGTMSYPRFSWEEILALQPEVVIIASMAGGYSEQQLKAEWSRWPQIPAVRQQRVYVVDAALFDRPVPRLADGLLQLAELLHPGEGHE